MEAQPLLDLLLRRRNSIRNQTTRTLPHCLRRTSWGPAAEQLDLLGMACCPSRDFLGMVNLQIVDDQEDFLQGILDQPSQEGVEPVGVECAVIEYEVHLEVEKQCVLVLIGATPEGKKELIGFQAGYRESTQSWAELLIDLKSRGLSVAPELAIGDGALGFWKALEQEFGTTRHQRCWVHKGMNVLNKFPKSVQPRAKADLKEIWMAEGRDEADKAFDRFLAKYGTKYDKAAECLAKDREALLAFYDCGFSRRWAASLIEGGHLISLKPVIESDEADQSEHPAASG